ncbi:hypothetical protein RFI_40004, partial [Reticulomyxa filosa]
MTCIDHLRGANRSCNATRSAVVRKVTAKKKKREYKDLSMQVQELEPMKKREIKENKTHKKKKKKNCLILKKPRRTTNKKQGSSYTPQFDVKTIAAQHNNDNNILLPF